MPKVERAIITAAGFGSRMNPITLDTPKPLVPVNGKPMIETTIDALRKQGIYEIYVIVGYLKEKFEYLTEKYPGLELIENPDYETANSISSLYAAREHLANSIVLDGDQIIYNDSVFAPEFERSGYNASYKEDGVPEWLAEIDENGIIQKVSIEGAEKGWAISGICRWTEEDANKLFIRCIYFCQFFQTIHFYNIRKFFLNKYSQFVFIRIYPQSNCVPIYVTVIFFFKLYFQYSRNNCT